MSQSQQQLVDAAIKAAREGRVQEVPIGQQQAQLKPIRVFLEPDAGGVGVTPDGQRFIRVFHFPYQVDIVLTEKLRRMYVQGLTGGIEVPT